MADTYLDMIKKLQHQSLDALCQAQDAQLATLATMRDMVASMPSIGSVPKFEDVPTMAALTEATSTFASAVLEQQKAYANKLAGMFDTAQHDMKTATDRVVNATVTAQKAPSAN